MMDSDSDEVEYPSLSQRQDSKYHSAIERSNEFNYVDVIKNALKDY